MVNVCNSLVIYYIHILQMKRVAHSSGLDHDGVDEVLLASKQNALKVNGQPISTEVLDTFSIGGSEENNAVNSLLTAKAVEDWFEQLNSSLVKIASGETGNSVRVGTINAASPSSINVPSCSAVNQLVNTKLALKQQLLSSTNRLNAAFVGDGNISNTEFSYLSGLQSNIQTQLSGKQLQLESRNADANGEYITIKRGVNTSADGLLNPNGSTPDNRLASCLAIQNAIDASVPDLSSYLTDISVNTNTGSGSGSLTANGGVLTYTPPGVEIVNYVAGASPPADLGPSKYWICNNPALFNSIPRINASNEYWLPTWEMLEMVYNMANPITQPGFPTGSEFATMSSTLSHLTISSLTDWPSNVTATEVSFLDGLTEDVQMQLNGKQASGNYLTQTQGDASYLSLSSGGTVTGDVTLKSAVFNYIDGPMIGPTHYAEGSNQVRVGYVGLPGFGGVSAYPGSYGFAQRSVWPYDTVLNTNWNGSVEMRVNNGTKLKVQRTAITLTQPTTCNSHLTVSGTFTGSDERIKHNITDASISDAYALASQIKIRSYEYNDITRAKQEYGVIAQEVEDVFPSAVQTRPGDYTSTGVKIDSDAEQMTDADGVPIEGDPIEETAFTDFKVVQKDRLFQLLFAAFQKAQKKIASLEARMLVLES
jgi:hypothetical protein